MASNDSLRAAVLQLSSQEDVTRNLAEVERLGTRAAELGAELIVLPENFAYFGPESGKQALAERLGDPSAPIQRTLAALAKSTRSTVIAGGFPERSDDPARPFNTAAVFTADGSLATSYRKIHLFDVELTDGTQYCESRNTSAGTEPVVADIAGFRVGLSVCYDLRFPELYRALVARGAEILVVPAGFTLLTGKDHWHALLRARAIESQCWVLAAAQWGKHPKGRSTYGHSLVCDPWGQVVAECSDRVGVVVADLERAYLKDVRTRLPSLEHQRLGRPS